MKKHMLVLMVLILSLSLLSVSAWTYEPEIHDFGGGTVVIMSHHMRQRPEPGHDWHDAMMLAEERYNVTFEFQRVEGAQILDALMTAVLSDTPVDFVHVHATNYAQLALQGALRPLTDVMPEEYWVTIPEGFSGRYGFRDPRTLRGEVYGIPYVFPPSIQIPLLVFNPKMIAEADLPNPYDLAAAGEWTWEALRDIARQLTADTTGDGQIDRWGLGGFALHSPRMMLGALATNGARLTKEVDGKVIYALEDGGKAAEILRYIELMTAVDGSVGPGWDIDAFRNEQVGIFGTQLWAVPTLAETENFDMGIIPLPLGPNVSELVYPTTDFPSFGIPITSRYDSKMLIDLMSAAFPLEELVERDMDLRLQGTRDEMGYFYMIEALTNWQVADRFMGILDNSNFWHHTGQVAAGNETPSTMLAARGPVLQAILDDVLDQ